MSYLLFIDESGHDRKKAPYEVLAGIAIHANDLWNLISAIHNAEMRHFGRRYSSGHMEVKGLKFLKSKVFQHASLNATIQDDDRTRLAKFALDHGNLATVPHWKALALAKLSYVRDVFEICARFRCKAFASIVECTAEGSEAGGLRKDYAYLFERFFYFLEDMRGNETGIIVFDELDKSQSHILIEQAHRYFRETATGRHRAGRVLPEPFFVHSDMTTGVQIADLTAYIISWGFRTNQMTKPARKELLEFSDLVANLRYHTTREVDGNPNFGIWSFAHIHDLRTRQEREDI